MVVPRIFNNRTISDLNHLHLCASSAVFDSTTRSTSSNVLFSGGGWAAPAALGCHHGGSLRRGAGGRPRGRAQGPSDVSTGRGGTGLVLGTAERRGAAGDAGPGSGGVAGADADEGGGEAVGIEGSDLETDWTM